MRKIEFRGRVRIPGMADGEEYDGYKNGDWVFGFVNVEYQKTFICWKDYDAIGEGVGDQDRKFPVDPKTVSQFVGLEDKNGKKIFEGDILKIYDERIFQVVDSILVHECAKAFYHILLKNSNYRKPLLYYETVNGFLFEVIGNVFDSADRGETTDQLKYELEQNGDEED